MRRYLNTFLRHPVLLALPVLVAVAVSVSVVLLQPVEYVAVGALWSDAPVPEASSLDQNTNSTPPSATTAAFLNELLHTRAFNLDVGRHSSYASALSSRSPEKVDRALAALSSSITIETPGPQLMKVSVRASSARRAARNATAYVDGFVRQVRRTRKDRADAVVDYYRRRVVARSQTVTSARGRLLSYIASHQSTALSSDPAVAQLSGVVDEAERQLSDVQDRLDAAELDAAHTSDPSELRVIDHPRVPVSAEGRRKELALAAVGGLLVGILISGSLIFLLTPRERPGRLAATVGRGPELRVADGTEPISGPGRSGLSGP